MNYLKDDELHLMGLFSQMLINVAWHDAVKDAMLGTMQN